MTGQGPKRRNLGRGLDALLGDPIPARPSREAPAPPSGESTGAAPEAVTPESSETPPSGAARPTTDLASIPIAQVIHPVTGTGFDTVGVEPDIAVASKEALDAQCQTRGTRNANCSLDIARHSLRGRVASPCVLSMA